ncbi:acyloxyacyl hydrolase [Marinirhabdus gelatinilytica]|uniref:Lipid A 3-O-deacylase PagL n=1 Tax=Marinirhabdus gelatinilytica TaxID=1703343 RepID=A0A370QLN8_9FLAO|nr:acyloxyacyl hydrolase [Marinirhabdus gelatinilytica]RDK89251.1 lipid A 3-O-deacylase PagL [Marinirhabdus gelatinilytica]
MVTFAPVEKKIIFLGVMLLSFLFLKGQEKGGSSYFLEASYHYGSLLVTNKNIAHLQRNQPEGVLLSFSKKTNGGKYWQTVYGYPDWGVSLGIQDYKSEVLDKSIIAYGHVNFYFFNRNLQFKVAQGIGVTTAPFSYEENFKNNAYGSRVIASTFLGLYYQKKNLYKGFGLQAGVSVIHHSNGALKAPNSGTNVLAASLGLNYNFDTEEPEYKTLPPPRTFIEPIKLNLFFRTGINEGETVGLGQEPFLVLGAFADKRLSFTSSVQLGTEIFFSKFLKNEIEYQAVSFFDPEVAGTDYKRVAVFGGYELHISKFSIPVQIGYYVYRPFEYELPFYERIGLKYYVKNNLYATFAIKAHAVNAEAIEFGAGIRL